ncbi:dna helicase, partial [Moniliophthora roreri MCA 2997]
MRYPCTKEGCPYPNTGANRNAHDQTFHGAYHDFPYNGNSITVYRQPDYTLKCPCGSPNHTRYNFRRLMKICKYDVHPSWNDKCENDGDDPNPVIYNFDCPSQSNELHQPEPNESYAPQQNESEASVPLRILDVSQPGTNSQTNPPLHRRSLSLDECIERDGRLRDVAMDTEMETSNGDSICVEDHIDDDVLMDTLTGDDIEMGAAEEIDDRREEWAGDEDEVMDVLPDQEAPTEDDVEEEDYDPSQPTPPTHEITLLLAKYSIFVDPVYRLSICTQCRTPVPHNYMRTHQANHLKGAAIPSKLRLPKKETIISYLELLNAHDPLPVPDHPIEPIHGVKIVSGVRCTIDQCTAIRSDESVLGNHWRKDHSATEERTFRKVRCQPLGIFRRDLRYVEVIEIEPISSRALKDIQRVADEANLLIPSEVYTAPDTASERNPVFAQLNWDDVLDGVRIADIRQIAQVANKHTEPHLEQLRTLVRDYYEEVTLNLHKIGTFARRCLLSSNPSELKAKPFRRPQERGTVIKDSDYISQFLSFLIRSFDTTIPNFPIVLHADTKTLLIDISNRLKGMNDSTDSRTFKFMIHQAIWSLLSKPSHKFVCDENMCPFTRFLIATHLLDDHGTFAKPNMITPNIAKAQWCFRATGAWEVIRLAEDYQGNTLRAYQEHVRMYLTETNTTLFTTLRQNMMLLKALARRQQGIARFNWNHDMTVLSIDQWPIRVADFINGVKSSIASVREGIKRLFRGCKYDDLEKHIEEGMVPDASGQPKWFTDSPQENRCRYSFFEEESNGFLDQRDRLLNHLVNDDKLFTTVADMPIIPSKGAIHEWFGQLDDVIREIFYLVVSTWGGGARGTELQHLLYANYPRHHRNLFMLNGLLTVVTEYIKTQSLTGAGKTIARTPAFEVATLLILVLWQAYWAAGHIGKYIGMETEDAQRYFYEVFVLSGEAMMSEDFSKALGRFNSIHLGFEVKLRDHRQLMSCMQISLTRSTVYDSDDSDVNAQWARESFGHSVEMGRSHYGLEMASAVTHLSSDSMAYMQRVSFRWQAVLELLHPILRKKLVKGPNGLPTTDSTIRLDEHLKEHFSALGDLLGDTFKVFEDRIIQTIHRNMQVFGSQLFNQLMHVRNMPVYCQTHTPAVHPTIRVTLQRILGRKGGDRPRFTSAEQAELINSIGSSMHVFGIIETGGGKSAAFFAGPKLFPSSLFVVVCPLVALTNDLQRRLTEYEIAGGRWGDPNLNIHHAQIILVSAHQAGTDEFYQWLSCPAVKSKLKRIFIDEAHKIITDITYRPCFKLFHYLTCTGVPITFLSGSLMPRSMPSILEIMKISDPRLVDEIRRYTGRPNLKYSVQQIEAAEYSDIVIGKVLEWSSDMDSKDRGMIFTRTIDEAKTLQERLDIPIYIAELRVRGGTKTKAEPGVAGG